MAGYEEKLYTPGDDLPEVPDSQVAYCQASEPGSYYGSAPRDLGGWVLLRAVEADPYDGLALAEIHEDQIDGKGRE